MAIEECRFRITDWRIMPFPPSLKSALCNPKSAIGGWRLFLDLRRRVNSGSWILVGDPVLAWATVAESVAGRQNFRGFGRHFNRNKTLGRIKIILTRFVDYSEVLPGLSNWVEQDGINLPNLKRFRISPVINTQNV